MPSGSERPGLASRVVQVEASIAPSGGAATAPRAIPIDPQLAQAIIYYYVRKDVSAIPLLMEALRTGEVMRSGVSRAALAGFFSMVFIQNRSRVEGWIRNGAYPGDSKAILEFSLWQSGNADLIDALFHERPDFLATRPGNLFTLTPRSPVEMDLKWGAFYATGNPGFIAAMVDSIDRSRILTGSRELDNAIRNMSAAGLAVNMRQHELIERFLRQREADATGEYKQALDAMLAARAAELKPAPDHDGEFSAEMEMMRLPEGNSAPEMPKPVSADGGPQTARRGDTIGISVLFSGMALAPDLSADVSYDMKVTGPDGVIDSRSTQTDVQALKQKVPTRFNVLDSRSTVSLHFEPDDKSGVYRVDILLKDNIGGRKVALSRSVELLDK
ncbi:hypothetical protein [Labrys monachus]|uniref:Uncharacterized protein n=1 Tax=Labrys monachus TaxID=217067 RepID=A0ABU0FC77_9HYPH|nr:hypothetical protein [Labrys monachus]MDQ0392210.1 hypothetical protein [Labrys monachus]